jgi:hypothetical protein
MISQRLLRELIPDKYANELSSTGSFALASTSRLSHNSNASFRIGQTQRQVARLVVESV